MEKFRGLLQGRRFILETDHKAIESLESKTVFGSRKMIRWFERLEEFDVEVRYEKEENIVGEDALRTVKTNKTSDNEEKEMIEINSKILECHEKNNHRKNMQR